jgi:hypothetical protein
MTTRLIVVAFAATASLAVAACGGGGNTYSGGKGPAGRGVDAKTKKALLQFAQCMRDHGVDMPDPQFGTGHVTMQAGGKNVDPETARAAQEACKKYQDQIKPPAMSAAEKAKFRQRALANAQCMRTHGVPNFPDPQFDPNGAASLQFDKGSGVDPNSPAFQNAAKACDKVGGKGGGPSTTRVEG